MCSISLKYSVNRVFTVRLGKPSVYSILEGEHAEIVEAQRQEARIEELPHIERAGEHGHIHRQRAVE